MTEQANWNMPIYESPAQQWVNHLQSWARGQALDINYEMCHGEQTKATSQLTAAIYEARRSSSRFTENTLKTELHERGIAAIERPLMADNGRVYLYVMPMPEYGNKTYEESCKILNPKR